MGDSSGGDNPIDKEVEGALTEAPQSAEPVIPPPESPSVVASGSLAIQLRDGDAAPESHFWLRRNDQRLLACLACAMLGLLAIHGLRLSKFATQPVEIDRLESRRYDFRVDINSANWVEWTQLDGIGDALARRIVADREANGPFQSIEDLDRVKGIGPKTIARLRPWLKTDVGGTTSVPKMSSNGP